MHLIYWQNAHDSSKKVNGHMKGRFKELSISGAQNTTICKFCSRGTVKIGKMYYSVGWLLKMLSKSRLLGLEVD